MRRGPVWSGKEITSSIAGSTPAYYYALERIKMKFGFKNVVIAVVLLVFVVGFSGCVEQAQADFKIVTSSYDIWITKNPTVVLDPSELNYPTFYQYNVTFTVKNIGNKDGYVVAQLEMSYLGEDLHYGFETDFVNPRFIEASGTRTITLSVATLEPNPIGKSLLIKVDDDKEYINVDR